MTTTPALNDDLVRRLNDIWRDDDHERGCRGREYYCTCGFDERTYATAKEAAERISVLERALEFTARWAWRTSPPNATNKLSDEERLSAIKYHPTIKGLATGHIQLAEAEARTALKGA